MDKDFMQYVYARIEKALTENVEYTELLNKCAEAQQDKNQALYSDLSDQMEAKAEELCYMKGFNDAMQMMLNSKQEGEANLC